MNNDGKILCLRKEADFRGTYYFTEETDFVVIDRKFLEHKRKSYDCKDVCEYEYKLNKEGLKFYKNLPNKEYYSFSPLSKEKAKKELARLYNQIKPVQKQIDIINEYLKKQQQ